LATGATPVVSLTLRMWAFLALVLAALAVASPTVAQDAEPDTSIRGTVQVVTGDDRAPVEGVTVRVSQGGAEVGQAVTDAEGFWEVAVPAAGTYQVILDVDSLPDDVAPPPSAELDNVSVRDGQNKTVRFNLGPGRGTSGTFWDKVPGRLMNGLTLGALVALAAVGLSLIFGVTELTNFAHGEFLTVAAAVAFFLHASSGGPEWALIVAAVPGIAAALALGWGQERVVWRPLRRRRVGTVTTLVTSIGLSFAIRNVVLVLLGGNPVTYRDYAIQRQRTFLFFDTVPKNVVIIGTTVVMLAAVGLFLQRTRAGVAVRAVADNRDLAESSGIDVNRVIMITWLLGGALAGLAGVYLGVSTSVQWDMGFNVLLLVFAAVVLGGLGTAFGAMLGGFLVGLMVELSTLWLSSELKNAVAMAALIAMLLWRPQGLLGSRGRIG
jgi:neutral amino acid transport system permease protein